jgi:hypothetical protein
MPNVRLLFLLLVTAGCGGAPHATVVAASPSSPLQVAPTAVVEPSPVFSQVPKPTTLIAVARLNDVDRSTKSIDQLFKLSTTVRSLIDAQIKDSPVILSGSLDVAVALGPGKDDEEPTFLWAFSIPLKSVEDAVRWRQAEGDDVVPTTAGAYRVKGKGGGLVCDVMPSLGDAPARGVCADKVAAIALLAPWMTRGLSTEPKQPEDMSVRFTLAPLKNRYFRRLKAENDDAVREARSSLSNLLNVKDPDLLAAPEVIGRELLAFVGEARAFDSSFRIDPDAPEMRFTFSLETTATRSWLTQVLASATDNATTPPDMFYRLPKDSVSGWWGQAADPSLFTGIRAILHKSVVAIFAMPFAHVSAGDQQAALAWLDGIPAVSGTWVRASGVLPHGKRPEKIVTAQQAVDEAKVLFQTYLAWGISGEEGDPNAFIAWLKQTQDALRRGIAALEKQDADVRRWTPTATFIANVPGYPKGSAALDVGLTFSSKDVWDFLPQNKKSLLSGQDAPAAPTGPPAKGKVAVRILVVPDGDGHFWWGLSTDPAALQSHISQVLKGAPASHQLASRTDLDPIKYHKGFGGFFNLASVIDASKTLLDEKQVEVIEALPHKGQGAIYLLGSRTGTSAPTFSIAFSAGKDMLEDISAALAGIPVQPGLVVPPVLGPLP